MLPIKKEKHLLRYYDLKGFERKIEADTKEKLEIAFENLIKTGKATLVHHVFSKIETWA